MNFHLVRSMAALSMLALCLCGCDQDGRVIGDTAFVAADTKAIENLEQQLTAAYKARDWEQFSNFFEPDGVWMPPDRSPLIGKEAWWAFVGGYWLETTLPVAELKTEEVLVIGDWAIERHTEKMVIEAPSLDEPIVAHFKGMHVLRRQPDGGWKIARYMWNRNPAPE